MQPLLYTLQTVNLSHARLQLVCEGSTTVYAILSPHKSTHRAERFVPLSPQLDTSSFCLKAADIHTVQLIMSSTNSRMFVRKQRPAVVRRLLQTLEQVAPLRLAGSW